jgi:hypothetical protein
VLEPEPLPCPPEAGDDFVGCEQDVVAIADLADARESSRRAERSTPPTPITGSARNIATVSAPLADDGVLERTGRQRGNVHEARHARLELRPVSAIPVALIVASVVP